MRNLASFIFLIVFVMHAGFGFSQNTVSINKKANIVVADKLDKLYLVSGTEVFVYNLSGKMLSRYSNSINGNISSIDVNDPLRIVVFYDESNTIQFLNQQLTEISDAIDVYELSDTEAQLVCSWNMGGFCLFDPLSQTILQYDSNRTLVWQTENIAAWLNGSEVVSLHAINNQLQLVVGNGTVLVFDAFGSFLKRHHVNVKSGLSINGNTWTYWNGTSMAIYNELTQESEDIMFNANALSMLLLNKKLVLQFPDRIEIKDVKND